MKAAPTSRPALHHKESVIYVCKWLFCGELVNLADGEVHAAHLPGIEAEAEQQTEEGSDGGSDQS